jgi:hypothetical protein
VQCLPSIIPLIGKPWMKKREPKLTIFLTIPGLVRASQQSLSETTRLKRNVSRSSIKPSRLTHQLTSVKISESNINLHYLQAKSDFGSNPNSSQQQIQPIRPSLPTFKINRQSTKKVIFYMPIFFSCRKCLALWSCLKDYTQKTRRRRSNGIRWFLCQNY